MSKLCGDELTAFLAARDRSVDYSRVPAPHMVGGVRNWIEAGKIGKDSFLWAVVTNDLRMAFAKADDINLPLLQEWVRFFHWEVSHLCWGSVTKANAWAKAHRDMPDELRVSRILSGQEGDRGE
jgi:hypothetical protein